MKTPKISDTEWEVMRALWERHPATAAQIIARLSAADPSWHPKTARTLLARLVRKKALRYERRNRVHVYEPAVTERECLAQESQSFLARFFGGSLRPMLAHFVEREQLTERHLRELEKLLERKERRPSRKGANHE